jgi:hypothetical protein
VDTAEVASGLKKEIEGNAKDEKTFTDAAKQGVDGNGPDQAEEEQKIMDRIKESIPHLRKEIKDQQEKTAQELESLGTAPPSCASESREMLANFLRTVMGDVDGAIGGNYTSKVFTEEPPLLMRICAKSRELQTAFNLRIINDKPQWTISKIKQAINSRPYTPHLAVPRGFVKSAMAAKTYGLKVMPLIVLSTTPKLKLPSCLNKPA